MEQQTIINAISALNGKLGVLLSVNNTRDIKVVTEKILGLVDRLESNPINYLEDGNSQQMQRPERPLQRPAAYPLSECLKELKFGRPAKGQEFLDGCISELHGHPEYNTPFK